MPDSDRKEGAEIALKIIREGTSFITGDQMRKLAIQFLHINSQI